MFILFLGVSKKVTKKKEPPARYYTIDYKNTNLMYRYIDVAGKILHRRVTGLTSKEHRLIRKSIRRSRRIYLLPFVRLVH